MRCASWLRGNTIAASVVHHYVFFNRDRERIRDKVFLETKAIEGAQLKYTWRQLEPEKDRLTSVPFARISAASFGS